MPNDIFTLANGSSTSEEFLKAITISLEDADAVEINTRSQNTSTEWKRQRDGRITGLHFYPVFTKAKTEMAKSCNSLSKDWC